MRALWVQLHRRLRLLLKLLLLLQQQMLLFVLQLLLLLLLEIQPLLRQQHLELVLLQLLLSRRQSLLLEGLDLRHRDGAGCAGGAGPGNSSDDRMIETLPAERPIPRGIFTVAFVNRPPCRTSVTLRRRSDHNSPPRSPPPPPAKSP